MLMSILYYTVRFVYSFPLNCSVLLFLPTLATIILIHIHMWIWIF